MCYLPIIKKPIVYSWLILWGLTSTRPQSIALIVLGNFTIIEVFIIDYQHIMLTDFGTPNFISDFFKRDVYLCTYYFSFSELQRSTFVFAKSRRDTRTLTQLGFYLDFFESSIYKCPWSKSTLEKSFVFNSSSSSNKPAAFIMDSFIQRFSKESLNFSFWSEANS